MRWYRPSWNGDLRLVDRADGRTVIYAARPTASERETLAAFLAEARKLRWTRNKLLALRPDGYEIEEEVGVLDAPVSVTGPVFARIAQPGAAVVTAVRMVDGRVEVVDNADSAAVVAVAEKAATGEKAAASAPQTYRDPAPGAKTRPKAEPKPKPKENKPKESKEKKEAVAATLHRPTPCCPSCMEGSIEPAREVLLSFLDDEEHESWARNRTIVVQGGLSGHRYLIAHRHSDAAKRIGRICYDLDDWCVVHFHDWSVPPEEEVLAAKIILEHREPWLRNEATVLCAGTDVYKNPFGGCRDGVEDSLFAAGFGGGLMESLKLLARARGAG